MGRLGYWFEILAKYQRSPGASYLNLSGSAFLYLSNGLLHSVNVIILIYRVIVKILREKNPCRVLLAPALIRTIHVCGVILFTL